VATFKKVEEALAPKATPLLTKGEVVVKAEAVANVKRAIASFMVQWTRFVK
jgi:hypothetical protein